VDRCLLNRRAVLRATLLGVGACLLRPGLGAARGVEREHQPRLDLPILAEDPTAVPVVAWVDHPMEPDHFITSIEVTLETDPVARKGVFLFTPANGRARVAFQMRSGVGGLVKVTAECSRHGRFVGTREVRVAADGCTSPPDKVTKDRIGNPVLRVPGSFTVGEVIEVRAKIDHPSDTGLAFKDGKFVLERPEFFVTQMRVSFDGQLISDFRLTSAVSPNPLIRFPLKVTGTGALEVGFVNNEGKEWQVGRIIRPTG
jgi:desulfoferrodoxin (superoxide reductase-like protein)